MPHLILKSLAFLKRMQKYGYARSWMFFLLLLTALGQLAGCAATEHLSKGQYLLKKGVTFVRTGTEITDSTAQKGLDFSSVKELGVSTVDPYLLSSSIRTKENRRMLFPKTYLHLYMLGKSLQIPLDSLTPPTRGGKVLKKRWRHDMIVIGQSPLPLLAFVKYIDYRIFPSQAFTDSLGSFLENTAGEGPKLIDTAVINQDLLNLRTVYFSEGFFYSQNAYEIDTCRWEMNQQKARVKYKIWEGKAAVLDSLVITKENIPNSAMLKLLENSRKDSKLKNGELYREDNISSERSRIVTLMRNHGYYTFRPDLVSFVVDTLPDSINGYSPKNIAIKNYSSIHIIPKIKDEVAHKRIRNISFAIEPAELHPEDQIRDTLLFTSREKGMAGQIITFIGFTRTLEKFDFSFLEQLLVPEKGELYSLQKERVSQRRLQNLGIFKYVLVKHYLAGDSIDIRVEAQLLKKYYIKAGVEGFSENDPFISQNLPGFGIQLGLRDLMVFKGAERFDFSMSGKAAFYRPGVGDTLAVFLEGNASVAYNVPRFLVPFIGRINRGNLQKYNPHTTFSLKGSREDSQAYTRNSMSLDWNYNWSHNLGLKQTSRSSVSPYVITFVTSRLSQAFRNGISEIEDPGLKNLFVLDFASRFSSWGRYQFSYSNYRSSKVKPTAFFQPTFEMGGNTPFLIDRLAHLGQSERRILGATDLGYKDGKLGNTLYGQYFKTTLEGRLNLPLSKKSSVVLRGLIGMAKPWNYSEKVPLASRFFAGGTNGMRGWQSNTLGPGTYTTNLGDTTTANFGNILNLGGEFQVEFNVELRANVYKFMELALFSDLGNVWFLPGSNIGFDGAEGAKLSKNNYLELGWDIGLGLRMDFSYFIFRIDLAQQIYAPDIGDFVVKSFPRDLGANRFQTNFGIGYPF